MNDLRRVLGTTSATALVVGAMVGSGIFLLPSLVATNVPSAPGILAVWAIGGGIALCGALAIAELASRFPQAGGQYVFLREAWGQRTGFLFGWMTFAVNYTGSIAAVAVAFAIYLGAFFPLNAFGTKLAAIALIWLLTLANLRGVRFASILQNASTLAKVGGIVALVVLAFVLPAPANANVSASTGSLTLAGFGVALGAVLFAYDGFASASFVAGEIRGDVPKTIARASILGVIIVVLVYLAANLAYIHVLGVQGVASSTRLAGDVAGALMGKPGETLFTLAVLASTLGLVGAFVLQSPRIYYAMAKDEAGYAGFARLNRTGAPWFGLILQAEWASLLVLWGSFDTLVGYVIVSSWTFNALTGLALFRLPGAKRRIPAAIFVAGSVFVVAIQFVATPRDAIIGMALTLSGLPVYWLVSRKT